jgi:hypothetical protein
VSLSSNKKNETMKTYSTKELKEHAEAIFRQHPKESRIFATDQGNFFHTKEEAEESAEKNGVKFHEIISPAAEKRIAKAKAEADAKPASGKPSASGTTADKSADEKK